MVVCSLAKPKDVEENGALPMSVWTEEREVFQTCVIEMEELSQTHSVHEFKARLITKTLFTLTLI